MNMWPSGTSERDSEMALHGLQGPAFASIIARGENKTSSVAQGEKEMGSGHVDTEFTEQLTSDTEKHSWCPFHF